MPFEDEPNVTLIRAKKALEDDRRVLEYMNQEGSPVLAFYADLASDLFNALKEKGFNREEALELAKCFLDKRI